MTDSDDAEMFDNAEEDKDLASQVSKESSSSITTDGPVHPEVVGSPITPEKLDPSMDLDRKATSSAESENASKTEEKDA